MKRKKNKKREEVVECHACKGEGEIDGKECALCRGAGTLTLCPYDEKDFKLVRRYIRTEWWRRLRVAKKAGAKLGSKKERDKLIERQAKSMYLAFRSSNAIERGKNRTFLAMKVAEFEAGNDQVAPPVEPESEK